MSHKRSSDDIFRDVLEDPSSLYLNSRVGLALMDTLRAMNSSSEFASLTEEQKKVIETSMINSMKKLDLVNKVMDKQMKTIEDEDEAALLETKRTSLEIKGEITRYNIYKNTSWMELEKCTVTRNEYEILLRNERLSILAVECDSVPSKKKK